MNSPELLRIPAHSHEAEQGVLGALLLHNDAWDRMRSPLAAADFYRHQHQLVFGAIASLLTENKPADAITVFEHLEKAGKGEEAGGLSYLNELAQAVLNSATIERYAEIVRERAIMRRMADAGSAMQEMAFDPTGKAVSDRLAEAEAMVLAIADGGRQEEGPEISGLVQQLIDMVSERADNPSDVIGLPTGYADLDRITAGLQAGDLIILAARPSMGKTALAINIAEHVAIKEGLPVAVFSMEMGALQLVMRIIASIGRINLQHLRNGKLTDEEWPRLTEALERMRDVKLEIDERPGIGISEIRSRARRWKRKYDGKLSLIVVDYLQLMSISAGMSDENRATAVGELSRGLKLLAKEMGCPVIALSQLSRGVEQRTDKRPMMSDLRESGAIEQDADVIMFIYRDDYYNKDSKEPGVAEVIISKQRSGPTGTVKMTFLKEMTRFENLARHHDD